MPTIRTRIRPVTGDHDLEVFALDFAEAAIAVDGGGPPSPRKTLRFRLNGLLDMKPSEAIPEIARQMKRDRPDVYEELRLNVPYPGESGKCDLGLGDGPQIAIEVKMIRPSDEAIVRDILSPWACDGSALAEAQRLAKSDFPKRVAMLLFGFDDEKRPLDGMMSAFETLLQRRTVTRQRHIAAFGDPAHPELTKGRVFIWELARR